MDIQPDKKLSLKALIQGFAAHVKDDSGNDTGNMKSVYPDSELAKIASTRLGKKYSEDAIRKARQRQGIERCTTLGGCRPGAGRPRSSESKSKCSKPPIRYRHNLSISTAGAVKACLSAYSLYSAGRDGDTFDYCNNRYTKLETWKYTGEAARPHDLPARYSPAPVSLGSYGHKRFRLSQPDLQKFEAVK
jgi:hypothetical protein